MTTAETAIGSLFLCTKNPKIHAIIVGAVLMVAALANACGEELSLLVNGWSRHLDVPEGVHYNEGNYGLGLQYDFNRYREDWVPFVTVSGFKDSMYNMSYYAGGGIMRRFDIAPKLDNLYLDAGLVAFVMTRKNYQDGNPFLGILPVATFGTEHLAVNVAFIPKVQPKLIPLFFFQLKIQLKKD